MPCCYLCRQSRADVVHQALEAVEDGDNATLSGERVNGKRHLAQRFHVNRFKSRFIRMPFAKLIYYKQIVKHKVN